MPFPLFRSKKNVPLSSDAYVQGQPLLYAQPSYAPSEKDCIIRSPPTVRPVTHKAIGSDVFADTTHFKEQKQRLPRKQRQRLREWWKGPQAAEESEEPFERQVVLVKDSAYSCIGTKADEYDDDDQAGRHHHKVVEAYHGIPTMISRRTIQSFYILMMCGRRCIRRVSVCLVP
jgi:hypothetical protein